MRKESSLIQATPSFLLKEGKVSLGRKVRGIGKDCWNGYGGKVEDDETIIQSAKRELKDEVGVIVAPRSLKKVAEVYFHNNTESDGEKFIIQGYVYLVRKWTGEPQEVNQEEILTPTWLDVKNLPFDEMIPADRIWVPHVLSGKKIIVKASFGSFQKELLGEVQIQEVKKF